jgi:CRISPR-associated protein Csb1
LDYASLLRAVASDAALRRRQRLQPAGGKGDKIFPPTYPPSDEMKRLLGDRSVTPPRHVFERRRIDGAETWCVLVDSVQSQANRLEEALLAAVRDGSISLPYVTVDFTGKELAGIGEITSLDAPHRVYDAILRDSLLDGEPFMKSELGLRLAGAKPNDATALLEASPTALLFGVWHSQGEGGGLGAKFQRCLVSEIVAIDTPVDQIATPRGGKEVLTSGQRTGSRVDPLGILRNVQIYQSADDPQDWTASETKAARKTTGNKEPILFSRKRGDRAGRPSVINHGNVAPSVQPLGITCDYAEHVAVITLAGLRRLSFGGGERDRAGRSVLAALGLVALAEQDARGYALRSRCDLVCEGRAPLELVHADGSLDRCEIDRSAAQSLYGEAYKAARDAGFDLPREPIRLVPQDKLVEIVRRSQRLALEGEGGETADDS